MGSSWQPRVAVTVLKGWMQLFVLIIPIFSCPHPHPHFAYVWSRPSNIVYAMETNGILRLRQVSGWCALLCDTCQLANKSLVFPCSRNLQFLQKMNKPFDTLGKMKIFIANLCLKKIYFHPGYVTKTQLGNLKSYSLMFFENIMGLTFSAFISSQVAPA